MDKKVLIGTAVITRNEVEMTNLQFEYAASYERLRVSKGEYPIYAYVSDLQERDGKLQLVGSAYFGYEGTVVASNVGGKEGDHTYYHACTYDFMLAKMFIKGHDRLCDEEYVLRPEWGIELVDYISSCDDKRHFMFNLVLKDGAELTYMDNEDAE